MKTLLLLLLCSVSLSAAAPTEPESAESLLRQAVHAQFNEAAAGNLSAPGRLFSAILSRDPNNARAKFELLLLDRWMNRAGNPFAHVEAISERADDLKSVLDVAKKTDLALYHFMSAVIADLMNDFPKSIQHIEQSVKLKPNNPEYLFWKGRIYSDYDDADPTNTGSLKEKSFTALLQAKALALKSSENVLPEYAYDWQIAFLKLQQSPPNYAEAIHYFKVVADSLAGQNVPRLGFAYLNIAINSNKVGSCEEAAKYARLSLEILPKDSGSTVLALAEACIELQKESMSGGSLVNK